ncbi:restriction endonuclease subunit S [Plebeiibacterium marinum]|uniref:Restriction endonuclease subunit S n=1 Tax=Plebeiibacterium marinum TaxID=2992111 RepID=A0AAE3MHB6_9BACT|nr:restriction endonuclease subunit S [Plebeiobacterium marinum]MCW3807062.1 restriction endonuclease subunit S [Plebeiobacterium marinum]
MSWKKVKLGNTATFTNGYAFKPQDWDSEGKEIIRIQNLTGKGKDINYFNGDIDEKYKVTKGDLLISWSATLGIFEWQKEDAWLNQHIFKVVFNKMAIDKAFFKHLISSILMSFSQRVHGSTMKHITKGNFDNTDVSIPSLPEQKRIATILDKAEALCQKNKEQLAVYDELLQSVFLDIFGDPVSNPMGWEKKVLINLISNIDGGWSPKCDGFSRKSKENWAILTLSSISERTYKETFNKNLPESLSPKTNLEVKSNDLLFSRKNTKELVGACAYVFNTQPKLMIPDTIFRINYIPLKINGVYTYFLLNHINFRKSIQKLATGSAGSMPNISKEKLKKLYIPLPPITLQNKFAQIVENIEAQKELLKKSINESDDLFNGLVQKAFKGEL